MENTKNVIKWGNSGGILLPKEWIGKEVQILLVDRTSQIKKEVFDILDSYLEDIIGIYLVGSYARNEQDKSSDIDIIVISYSTKKEIISGKYHISITSLENLKKTLDKNPILVLPRLKEAKIILNPLLLEELKNIKMKKTSFKKYFEETKRIIKINKGLLNLEEKEILESNEIIYSLILRLRGIYLIHCILQKRDYTKKEFLKYLLNSKIQKEEIKITYNIYKKIRDNKKTEELKLKTKTAGLLLSFVEEELKKLR